MKADRQKHLTLRGKRILAIITFIVALSLIAGICYFIFKALHFSLRTDGNLTNAAENFKTLIESYGGFGILVALGIHILQVIVSPLPGEIIEIGMGLCFGWLGGTVICLLGSAIGAIILMLFVKKLGTRFVELFVSLDKINNLRFINEERKLERLAFIVFLIPGTPKDMLIFFFGLTKIKISNFIVITTIARIPSIVSSTLGGDFIVDKNHIGAIILFAVTGALSLIGIFAYNKIMAKRNEIKKRKNEAIASIKDKEQ